MLKRPKTNNKRIKATARANDNKSAQAKNVNLAERTKAKEKQRVTTKAQ